MPGRHGFSCSDESFFFFKNCLFLELLPVQNGNRAEIVTESFLQEVFDILMDFIKKSNDRSNKILDFHHPDQLLDAIDLSVPDQPQNLDQILVDCKDALKYQVKTGNFVCQIYKLEDYWKYTHFLKVILGS